MDEQLSAGTASSGAIADACVVGLEADDAEGVLRMLADGAIRVGYAGASFAEAIVERERVFPTGLPTPVPVAIPHADARHVRRDGFAVATLARPVTFGVMGSDDEHVDVDVVVALLVTEPHAQVTVLMALIEVFQRDGWDAGLRAADTPDELAAAFDALLAA